MEGWKNGRMEKPLRVAGGSLFEKLKNDRVTKGSFLPSREKRSGCWGIAFREAEKRSGSYANQPISQSSNPSKK
jgi:hypothetical protein